MQPDEGIVQSITKVVGLLSRRLHQILIWMYFKKPTTGNGEWVFLCLFYDCRCFVQAPISARIVSVIAARSPR